MDYRAGMFVYALAFLLGDIFVQQLSLLPDQSTLVLVFFAICLLCLAYLRCKQACVQWVLYRELTLCILIILLFLIGFSYTVIYAERQLSNRLDEHLSGKSLLVTGFVSDIPAVNGHVQRFTFDIESFKVLAPAAQQTSQLNFVEKAPRKIRLSWYYGQDIQAAEKWQFEIRLKPPHGFMNLAGFDYESWLFQHAIDATGYVRKSAFNERIQNVSNSFFSGYIDRQRQKLAQLIDSIAEKTIISEKHNASGTGSFSLVKALAIGDKSSISNAQWLVLINTGTSHLMAISGLHIGLAALFAYIIFRRLTPSFIAKRIPAQHVALIGGMFAALLYALIAGLSIPTQRAIIMLFVVSMMMLIRHNHRPIDALGFALLVVLLFDPLAVLAVGFWFSFAAVAVIFVSLSAGVSKRHVDNDSILSKILSTLRQWVRLQLAISIFLLPLSLFMFQQVSLISPIANFLLIPYISFLVVPVVLLALVFVYPLPAIAELLFILAADMIDLAWPVLNYLSLRPYALWVQGEVDITVLLSATAAVWLIFYVLSNSDLVAKKWFKKYHPKIIFSIFIFSATVLMLPLFVSNRHDLKSGEYSVTVLDVGQGSAAVLQTRNHNIVFDAGAKFSDKLDVGRSVVIPYLRSQGIKSLDYLIISHGDSDHIGGAPAIIRAYPATIILGQDIDNLLAENKQPCLEGLKWHWDGVDFMFLSPATNEKPLLSTIKRNNRSCVLHVASAFGSVLFTGDIEKKVERKLLKNYQQYLSSDILIAPHHGSNTSSSTAFIAAVDPEIVIFSAGYKNRYKLPAKKVIDRYSLSDARMVQTAQSGAINIKFTDKDGLEMKKYRETAGKYWNHIVN